MDSPMRKMSALAALAESYEKTLSKTLMKMWLKLLDPYTDEQVEAGVMKVIETYSFKTLPPFAVLKKAIEEVSGIVPEEDRTLMAAKAEWNKVREQIREVGRYRTPHGLHETTQYVLRLMGGWSAACDWYSDEMHWREKEFTEHWCMAHGNIPLMLEGASAVLEGRKHRPTAINASSTLASIGA